MTLARTWSVALIGVEGHVVEVEADVGGGLPAFQLVGLPERRWRGLRGSRTHVYRRGGTYTVRVKSVDKAGNERIQTRRIRVR